MDYNSRRYALSHWHNPRHLAEVLLYLKVRKEDKILEIGCSRGFVARALQEKGFHVQGIDSNAQAVKEGVAENLRHMSATHLRFPANSFDKLYSFHTIEHIPNIRKALEEMVRVVRPKGRILLAYPAEPIRGLFALAAALLLKKSPRDIHVHKLNPRKLQGLLRGMGVKHVESRFSLFSSPQFFTVLEKRGVRKIDRA